MQTLPKTVPDLFQLSRQEWLERARRTAQEIILRHGYCTVEDVLAICPRPDYVHRNVTGHVFQNDIFKFVRYTKSRRPISNARTICVWTIDPQYMPQKKEPLLHRVFYRNRHREDYGEVV